MDDNSNGVSSHYFKDRNEEEDYRMTCNHSLNEESEIIISWLNE